MKAIINGQPMPLVFNGDNVVIALDPSINKKDQRVCFYKSVNDIKLFETVRGKRKRKRMSRTNPFVS